MSRADDIKKNETAAANIRAWFAELEDYVSDIEYYLESAVLDDDKESSAALSKICDLSHGIYLYTINAIGRTHYK